MARRRNRNDSRPRADKELYSEVATRARDPYEQTFMGVIRPNDSVLLEKGGNIQTYIDLERDGKVFAGLQKRTQALISRPWQVEPAEDTPAGRVDAETVQQILEKCSFDRVCNELLQAILVGFAVSEIVWTVRDGWIVPGRIINRQQRRFVYIDGEPGQPPELRLKTAGDMIRGIALPPQKFIVHRFRPVDDNPYGTGLGRQLYWPVFFKRKGIIAWNKLNDRFGTPTPWGKYSPGAGNKERRTLFDALKAISSDGVIVTPNNNDVQLIESKMTGPISSQESLCKYMDDWISEVITGQEPRGQSGGALASASKERETVRLELTQADGDLLAETLNSSLVAWICELNGFAPCQVSRTVKRDEDLREASETDRNVSEMGFELTEEAVRAKYGEGWVKRTMTPPADTGMAARFAEADNRDAIDRVIDELLGDWEPVMSPLVEPLLAEIAAAAEANETAAQMLDRLAKILPDMDASKLADALDHIAGAARLAGNAGDALP